MRFVMFYHSLASDWNHGNAHFLRGLAAELLARGHQVAVYEPEDGWSATRLRVEHGAAPFEAFAARYPTLRGIGHRYRLETLDLDGALAGADVVMVHEWNEPALVRAVAERRQGADFLALFHDTHHRATSDPEGLARCDLGSYDAVLAFGDVLRQLYLERGWCRRAFTWHEAADARLFHPPSRPPEKTGDLVWIGNWGDDERTAELHEFLLDPVKDLHLHARIHGVRYPAHALSALCDAGIDYAGWLPNYEAPQVFARYRVTVHVPRRPYVRALPGIPTIRVFEALACGIPLVSAPWDDCEGLFEPGADFLVARDGAEMRAQLRAVLNDPALAQSLAGHGLRTILARHTCAHRVDELMAVVAELTRASRTTILDENNA